MEERMLTRRKKSFRPLARLIPVAILLAIGDAWSTIYCIQNGLGYEYNPTAAVVQNQLGLVTASWVFAVYFSFFVSLFLYGAYRFKSTVLSNTLLFGTLTILLVKTYVVFSNFSIILG